MLVSAVVLVQTLVLLAVSARVMLYTLLMQTLVSAVVHAQVLVLLALLLRNNKKRLSCDEIRYGQSFFVVLK